MTPGPRKRGLELSGGVRSPPQVPRRNADRRARCASARAGPEARASGNIRSRGSDSTPCVCRRSASLAFLFSCSEWKRRRREKRGCGTATAARNSPLAISLARARSRPENEIAYTILRRVKKRTRRASLVPSPPSARSRASSTRYGGEGQDEGALSQEQIL